MHLKPATVLVSIAAFLLASAALAQVQRAPDRPLPFAGRGGPQRTPAPAIAMATIEPFLSRPYVLDKEQIDRAPYVVGFPEGHLLGGPRDAAYVRRLVGAAGQAFDIVRPGDPYRDPDTGEILGYAALFVANAILERPGNPAKVRIGEAARETGIGDRLIAATRPGPIAGFAPYPAPRGIKARIISVLDGVSKIGQYQAVVLNRGSREGLRPGHLMDVYHGGEEARDRVMSGARDWGWKDQRFWSQETWYGDHRVQGWRYDEPDPNQPFPPHVEARRPSDTYIEPYERVGTLMVFRSFPRVSFALVLHADRPIHLLDAALPPATEARGRRDIR